VVPVVVRKVGPGPDEAGGLRGQVDHLEGLGGTLRSLFGRSAADLEWFPRPLANDQLVPPFETGVQVPVLVADEEGGGLLSDVGLGDERRPANVRGRLLHGVGGGQARWRRLGN